MFDIFQKYLEEKIKLTEQDLELIQSVSVIKKLRKHQYLLQADDVWQYNSFVCKGFVRTYYVDNKGQERILNFSPENYWICGDKASLASKKPSKYNIDAIDASEILLIRKTDFEMLCKKIPVFNDFINSILQENFIAMQERICLTITFTAEEQYNNFIQKFPAIANRVPKHMIASYLGISAETLSRVRKQATKK